MISNIKKEDKKRKKIPQQKNSALPLDIAFQSEFNQISDKLTEMIQKKYNELSNLTYNDDTNNYDEFCKYVKNKEQLIGIFQFLGELYNEKVYDDKTIKYYIRTLIKKITDNENTSTFIELQSECLNKLIRTISVRSRHSRKKFNSLIIKDIEYLCENGQFKSRIKFMLLDLLDYIKKY